MSYSCENYIKDTEGNKYYKGDNIRVYKKGVWQFYGVITLITGKGIYVNCGGKKDKYFRADEIDEIAVADNEYR